MSVTNENEYPLYEIVVNGTPQWCPPWEAGWLWDSGFYSVRFGRWVINAAWAVPRAFSNADENEINRLADAIGDAK